MSFFSAIDLPRDFGLEVIHPLHLADGPGDALAPRKKLLRHVATEAAVHAGNKPISLCHFSNPPLSVAVPQLFSGRESSFFPFLSRRNALGFALSDQTKNRSSHRSHRNGLTKIMARIHFSRIHLRRD
jgi:hypothetical protein